MASMPPAWTITGGVALVDGRLAPARLLADPDAGTIVSLDAPPGGDSIDAQGLLVLPGIVDIHGDAFERQLAPRPRVDFPIDLALMDSDRQAVANGITTVFHGVTWSWEPGLRGGVMARAIIESMAALRPQLSADTRCHLRHETYNLADETEIAALLSTGMVHLLAFNDHMTSIAQAAHRADKLASMAERAGVSHQDFAALVERTLVRGKEVPDSIGRLAAAARLAGVKLVSHDDSSIEQRRWYRALGCTIAEFPTNRPTTGEAAAGRDHIVFGAPNVVRGGSHTGWLKAADMIADGLCDVLASDYYYPAPLIAAFRLVADGVASLPQAWALVSANAAAAAGLSDRGRLAAGGRADLLLVDAASSQPRLIATMVAGRLVYLREPDRLSRAVRPARQAAAG